MLCLNYFSLCFVLVACCLVAIIWGDVARNLCKIRCWWYTFMGEIGPRRIAVFIGYAYRKTYILGDASFPLGEIRLASQEKCASHKASP